MKYKITSNEAEVCVLQDGAMLTSLLKNDTEYLWQGDEEHWSGQAPICFPIVGMLPNNEGTAFEEKCVMKRHGIARINPFELKEQIKNSITFIQKSNDTTKAAFPFDYELEVKYTLVGSTVSVEYLVKNTGKKKMPFVIGGHPAFNCPLDKNEKFEDYKVKFDKALKGGYLRPDHHSGLINIENRFDDFNGKSEIAMRHDLFEEKDAMIFDGIAPKSATLIGPNGKGIKIEYQDMANLLIWSACGNADFVALEPWTGISNCSDETNEIEKKRGMTILEPNEQAGFKYKITMI
ncbi:aldose 1-epimerase family protein [uncultured Eubacterium sp.]|uniref:aldose 1-epimerase family protein n=1 Tax=uncultured Eubacterium sp. TaxID=165185 RepID=UPI002617873B|nr:aldose 1-epimerase family protein [uncultured Eubacterium sp.]